MARPLLEGLAVFDNKDGNIASIELKATKKIVKVIIIAEKYKSHIKKTIVLIIDRKILRSNMSIVFLNLSEVIIKGTIPKNETKTAGR